MPKKKLGATGRSDCCMEIHKSTSDGVTKSTLIDEINVSLPRLFDTFSSMNIEELKTDPLTRIFSFARSNKRTREKMTGLLLCVPTEKGVHLMIALADVFDADGCMSEQIIVSSHETSVFIAANFLDDLNSDESCNRLIFTRESNMTFIWVHFEGVLEKHDQQLFKFAALLMA